MPQYKLTYFNGKARGEPIRLILAFMGKEFEDCRLTREEWPLIKDKTPFGKVPVLEVDGKVLHQSLAILKYLAIEAGLAGNNVEETLEIEMIAGAFGDLFAEVARHNRTENPEEKQKLKETIINETIPFYMSKFETVLKQNGGYLANRKLSWADLYAVGYTSSFPGFLGIDLKDKYPFFKEYVERIHSLPGIREWIKKRPETVL